MTLMVLVPWEKPAQERERSKVFKTKSTYTFQRLLNRWQVLARFVAGDKKILKYLRYSVRSQIYAKSLPMTLVIGGMKRLELLKTRPELKANLWKGGKSHAEVD
jgi:hypothetical protein